ncbi:MAG: response regulator transcription factor [Saprospiraceae bacterium]|nr:response regulator transcription factor [Saprospiraceae bacterium]
MMHKHTVLLIDDSQPMGHFLALFLSSKYQVTICQHSYEAIGLLENGFQPDVVVTDLEMPGLSGIHLVGTLREMLPQTPIFVVSGVLESSQRIAALQAGADDFLLKPFHPAELDVRIGKAIVRSAKKATSEPSANWSLASKLAKVAAAF